MSGTDTDASPDGAADATAADPWISLKNFKMELQERDFWCWAAVATSVARFFGNKAITQVDVASSELGRDCTAKGSNDPCDIYWFLSTALAGHGHLVKWSFKAASSKTVTAEIDANRPLCVRSLRPDNGAHFLAVTGYLPQNVTGTLMLGVDDPLHGGDIVSYERLVSGYRGGRWSDSLLTVEKTP